MKLIHSPDPWLDKKVEPFDFAKYDAKDISEKMIDIMLSEGGIGLSANQVGLDAQIFVIKPILLENKQPFAIINPTIISVSEEFELMPEGCLSHPDLFLHVKRPRSVVANYIDINANDCTIELYDIDARCFLHEYDHLQGIEFTDRVSKVKLAMAEKKRKKRIKQYG